jgi:hypothetical protein
MSVEKKKAGRPRQIADEKRIGIAIDTVYMPIRKVAEKWGVEENTVMKIRDEQPADFLEEIHRKKKIELAERLWKHVEDSTELAHNIVQDALAGNTKVGLREISTHIGILYDKIALMRGDSTGATVNGINVMISIPDTLEKKKTINMDQ